ncbi:lactonase family protein [Nigerium massiliense]|uniref:lactonase family protein n=1 Tax=Nigerium massiliense TaxID=1522317 RepID=UPI00058C0871|nr:beta-propeller fold lactonase family protein [Nigerium massiliense]
MTRTLVLIANPGDETIAAFTLTVEDEATASLQHLATSTLDGASSTFAVDADRDLVYAGVKGETPAIVTLKLDRESGELAAQSVRPVDDAMTYLSLAHGGTVLLGASYGGGFGGTWPVGDDGTVGEQAARIEYPNVHCVVPSPDSANAYYVSLGADLIAQYDLADDGTLSPLDPATADAPAGSGPRHLILDEAGTNAYLMTEFTGEAIRFERDASGRLTRQESVQAFDTTRGLTQSVFGADPVENHLIWGADLHLAADEAYLLCSERCESTIATVSLDEDGALKGVVALADTEKQPRGFGVSPDGRHVVTVGEKSTEASLTTIATDGELVEVDGAHCGHGPNWVRMVTLDD